MNLYKKRDDAVSPVIGVMLMLVVTIVIAAVVVTFGTGMAEDATVTTPMALYEVDNIIVKDGLLQTIDLVHKGGDEMNLENLQVVLEPIGNHDGSGILHVRTGASKEGLIPGFIESEQMYEGDILAGDIQMLTVPGKSGDSVSISTGNRIRVDVQYDGLWAMWYEDEELMNKDGSDFRLEEGEMSKIIPGDLVKWTLSDTRTNGVIAKGEFVVPKA